MWKRERRRRRIHLDWSLGFLQFLFLFLPFSFDFFLLEWTQLTLTCLPFSPFFFQMYRTVKTTDKPAASSGQSDGSGEDDFSPVATDLSFGRFIGPVQTHDMDYSSSSPNAVNPTRWSNSSSRGAWPHTNSGDMDGLRPTTSSQIEDNDTCRSNALLQSNQEFKNPSLEFTLGRPDWHGKDQEWGWEVLVGFVFKVFVSFMMV